MSWFESKIMFNFFLIIGLVLLVFTIFDAVLLDGLYVQVLGIYVAMIIMLLIIVFYITLERSRIVYSVEEFEKTLKGGLYHFKCPVCGGIFAIKKSKSDNKKDVKMTCPDCGALGVIPSNPMVVENEIPEKKSDKANFKCMRCGERITVWAEGTDLYKNVGVYTCPFCGVEKPLKKI